MCEIVVMICLALASADCRYFDGNKSLVRMVHLLLMRVLKFVIEFRGLFLRAAPPLTCARRLAWWARRSASRRVRSILRLLYSATRDLGRSRHNKVYRRVAPCQRR